MQAVTPLKCPRAPRGLFIGKIKDQITMYVMSLFNHYITTQHSDRIIMDFHDLQMFLC
jgi:hypothetical protein